VFHQSDREFLAKEGDETFAVTFDACCPAADVVSLVTSQKARPPGVLPRFVANLGAWMTSSG
jgi:hypothetical protein